MARKKRRQIMYPPKLRAGIDLAMSALILYALAFHITGGAAHEWIGIAAAAFFSIHSIVNYHWYLRIFSGRYNMRRAISAILNIALLVSAVATIISGLAFSKYALSFLHLDGSMLMRQIHTTCAYWTFAIASLHLGLYWNRICAYTGISKYIDSYKIVKILLRLFSIPVLATGVWAFIERDFFGKLFLGFSFDFWNPQIPSFFFFAENILVAVLFMGISIFGAHFAKLVCKFGRYKAKCPI